ncbi:alpha/beta fold hydrolase [Marinobacter sp. DUT-3]|uniref:alpha/beta fold hydrolase n=1 Tax=Marinobacter sp. DUT-3 TaxID=3412036 RepID=UPI003D171738
MSMAEKMFRVGFGGFSRLVPTQASNVARKLMMSPRKGTPKSWELDMPEPDRELALGNETHLSIWQGGPLKVLFVHGWEGRVSQFAPLLGRLDRSLFTFYAVHPPGHGMSAAPESHPGKFIEAVRAALAFIGEPVHAAIGHSMGAGVLCYVQAHDRSIERLVLISGPAHFHGILTRFSAFLGLGALAEKRFLASVESHVGIAISDLDMTGLAEHITQPVMIVHDLEDKEIPFSEALQLHQRFPSCHLLETRALGHRRILQGDEVVERIDGFLCGFIGDL